MRVKKGTEAGPQEQRVQDDIRVKGALNKGTENGKVGVWQGSGMGVTRVWLETFGAKVMWFQ